MARGPAQVEYRESVYVGYRYYDAADVDVRYPFGHGLSYTTFDWTELEIIEVENDDASEQRFDVSVRVTNTGDRPGSDVVQVYVRDLESTVFRPDQELAGFTKVHLVPGESRRVTVQLDRRAFAFWDTTVDDWSIESGDFEIRVGASSRDIRASATVTLESDRTGFAPGPAGYHGSPMFERDAFAELYGRSLPDNVVDAPGHYTVDTPLADIRHPAATLLTTVMRRKVAAMIPAADEDDPLSLLFARSLQELPPRMMTMLSQGAVTPEATQAFVDICNGGLLRGTRKLVSALARIRAGVSPVRPTTSSGSAAGARRCAAPPWAPPSWLRPPRASAARAIGSPHGWNARLNVAQWIGMSSAPPTSRWARTASSGFMWMSGHALAVRADRQQRQVERPVRAAEVREAAACSRSRRRRTACAARPGDHPRRPQRGVAGEPAAGEVPGLRAVRVRPPTSTDSSQSSSTIRSSGTPQRRRCAPTPSGTTNGASPACGRGRVTVARSRWS